MIYVLGGVIAALAFGVVAPAGAETGAAKGEPIYLILAMTPDKRLRMKPQNLVVGLPLAHLEAVS